MLLGAYLWLPIAGIALLAWTAAKHGHAGALGLGTAAATLALAALTLTASDRPLAATVTAVLAVASAVSALVVERMASRRHRALQRLAPRPRQVAEADGNRTHQRQ